MKFTLDWLFDHLDTTATTDQILTTLTAIGLEVEEVEDKAKLLAPFTVGEIVEAVQHPNADRLRVCTVDTGTEKLQIVCGAPNARAGIKVVVSRPGDYIPGLDKTLGKSAIRGVDSQGMLCAADELGLGGEHDGILELPADAKLGAKLLDIMPDAGVVIIDINLTPNRSDCAGIRGIARDLAAAGLGTLKPLKSGAAETGFANPYSVTIDNTASCPAFGLRLIKGVKNGPSPAWLRARLEAIGIKPISALVDITNYLTFDQARPLHVFDAAKVTGQSLTIRNARDGETLEALNNKTYTLDSRMLVIADGKGVESLAGVMGGLASGCDETTTDVLLECALFSPESVAATGRALQLTSDARYRFERGVDPQSLTVGIAQATQMIIDICGGTASDITLAGEIPTAVRKIHYFPTRMAELTGVDTPESAQRDILEKLGCTVASHHGHYDVAVPSWRPDLSIPEDLVEEVLRLTGYDAIPATSLPPMSRTASITPLQKRVQTARRVIAARGALEVVSWSFMAPEFSTQFAPLNPRLSLVNPISADMAQMRPSIVGNLLHMAARNIAHGQHDAALFEVGPVYRDVGADKQEQVATLVRYGAALGRHPHGSTRGLDLSDIKGDLAALLGAFGLDIDAVPLNRDAPSYYHPGRSFALRLGPTIIAQAGALHPALLKAADVDSDVWALELFLDRLPQPKKAATTAKPLLKLPPLQALTRDFAFVVPRDMESAVLTKSIQKVDRNVITNVALFDVYAGDKIAADKKSLAVSVTLQPQGTVAFTDADIEALSQKIVAAAEKATGATLRA